MIADLLTDLYQPEAKIIKQLYQRHTDTSDPTKGDCFATCVAMILGLQQDEVPNFCGIATDWWPGFQKWLEERHLVAIEVNLPPPPWKNLGALTPGVPVILTGKSPRGDWLHSIVGMTRWDEGFEILYDPHPAGGGFDGPLKHVLFFAALRPDKAGKP